MNILFIHCADGNTALGPLFGDLEPLTKNWYDVSAIGTAVPPDLPDLAQKLGIRMVVAIIHTKFPECTGCGALDAYGELINGKSMGIPRLDAWLNRFITSSDPYTQAQAVWKQLCERLPDSVDILVSFMDHVEQQLFPVGSRTHAGENFLALNGWQEAVDSNFQHGVPAFVNITNAMAILGTMNEMACVDYRSLAKAQGFAQGQPFRHIVLTSIPRAPYALPQLRGVMGIGEDNKPIQDPCFSVYCPPGNPDWGVSQLVYALAHVKPDSTIWVLAENFEQRDEMVEELEADPTYQNLFKPGANFEGRVYKIVLPPAK